MPRVLGQRLGVAAYLLSGKVHINKSTKMLLKSAYYIVAHGASRGPSAIGVCEIRRRRTANKVQSNKQGHLRSVRVRRRS